MQVSWSAAWITIVDAALYARKLSSWFLQRGKLPHSMCMVGTIVDAFFHELKNKWLEKPHMRVVTESEQSGWGTVSTCSAVTIKFAVPARPWRYWISRWSFGDYLSFAQLNMQSQPLLPCNASGDSELQCIWEEHQASGAASIGNWASQRYPHAWWVEEQVAGELLEIE